jgi:hypothetical protein
VSEVSTYACPGYGEAYTAATAIVELEGLDTAFDDHQAQHALLQALLRQVGAAGDVAVTDIQMVDALQDLIEVFTGQAAPLSGGQRGSHGFRRQQGNTLDPDAADGGARSRR